MTWRTGCIAALASVLCGLGSVSADGVGGLQPGQRPGPYSFLIATGDNRGKSHCYVCETADRPAVIIFARSLSDPLGRLAHEIDRALTSHQKAELRGWVTFLANDQAALDADVVRWGQKHALRNLPLGIFEDAGGPPSYRLPRDADVTVLLSVRQQVAASYVFRPGELTEARVAEVVKALPRILGEKK